MEAKALSLSMKTSYAHSTSTNLKPQAQKAWNAGGEDGASIRHRDPGSPVLHGGKKPAIQTHIL